MTGKLSSHFADTRKPLKHKEPKTPTFKEGQQQRQKKLRGNEDTVKQLIATLQEIREDTASKTRTGSFQKKYSKKDLLKIS